MATINQVSFTDPDAVDIERIRRNQMLAMQLQNQAQQNLPGGQMVSGYHVPTSPLSHLAQALKGVNARDMMAASDRELKALGERRGAERASTLASALNAMRGTPESSEQIMDETAAGGEGQMATIKAPAVAANPRAGMEILSSSRDPMLQQLGMQQVMAQIAREQAPPERVDLGDRIGLVKNGAIVGYLPKGVTPDAQFKEGGAMARHQTPSGNALLSEQGAMQRHQTPSGSAILGAQVSREGHDVQLRGQNLVDQRAREANSIAGNKRADEATTDLRTEFNKLPEVKNYRSVVPIFESARKSPDTRSGDIELAYSVGKILDPDSVVREGELKLVGNAATVLNKVQGELRTLVMGKGRLTPETRSELMNMLQGRVGELRTAHDAARTAYEGVARARNLPSEQIFIELRDGGPSLPGAPPGTSKPKVVVVDW